MVYGAVIRVILSYPIAVIQITSESYFMVDEQRGEDIGV